MDGIIELIMTLPLVWKIIAIFIMVLGNVAYLFRKDIKLLFKGHVIVLRDHNLFSEKSFIRHKINRINVGSDLKNKLFRELLLVKYDSILKYSNEILNTKDLDKLSNAQFYSLIIKNMTLIVDDYNNKMVTKFNKDIFEYIMNHPDKGFNNIHEKTLVFIKGNIEASLKSDHVVLLTPEDKLDFLFDMYYIAMKIAITDVDKIYKLFNGDLDIMLNKCKVC